MTNIQEKIKELKEEIKEETKFEYAQKCEFEGVDEDIEDDLDWILEKAIDLTYKEYQEKISKFKEKLADFEKKIDELLEKYNRESFYRNDIRQFSIIKDLQKLKNIFREEVLGEK